MMSVDFDCYLIHPSIITNCNQEEVLEFIEDILRMSGKSLILLEYVNDFFCDSFFAEQYGEFIKKMVPYAKKIKKTFYLVSGMSMYECAIMYIEKKLSICFMGFPYPELRSLCKFIAAHNTSGKRYAALDFNAKRKSPAVNLSESDGKMAVDVSKISIDYKPIDNLESFASKGRYRDLALDDGKTTPSSYIYTYMQGNQKKILKSTTALTRDYLLKMEDLIELRKTFVQPESVHSAHSVQDAIPQAIAYDGDTARGVVFDHIEGTSFEKLYHDTFYKEFMEKNGYEANLVNRIYLLIQLYFVIIEYHLMGIYLSDIKGDNFIVTDTCSIVPIDADSFSYGRYYSSCPRPEMMHSPEKDYKRTFLQKAEFEQYSIMVMTYCFLMNGNYPASGKENNKFTLKKMYDDPKGTGETEKGKVLLQRWMQYPEYLRNVLYKGIVDNQLCTVEHLLILVLRCYSEIAHVKEAGLKKWLNRSPSVFDWNEYREILSAKPADIPGYVKIEKKNPAADTNNDLNRKGEKKDSASDTVKNTSRRRMSTTGKRKPKKRRRRRDKRRKITIAIAIVILLLGLYWAGRNNMLEQVKGYLTAGEKETEEVMASGTISSEEAIVSGTDASEEAITSEISASEGETASVTVESEQKTDASESDEDTSTDPFGDDLSSVRQDVELIVDHTDLEIKKAGSQEITVSAEGNIPDSFYFSAEYPSEVVTAEWGAHESSTKTSLTITGVTSGNYPVRVCLYDDSTDEAQIIAYKDINVNIYDGE